jgi:hypothetical protein
MRKILLGTTALMAAGALYAADAQAADPIKIGVGGFMTQRFGYGTTDVSPNVADPGAFDYDGFDVKQDAEIHFRGSTKLDNGITIGVVVELEAAGAGGSSSQSGNQTFTDQIDEEFLYATGSFGRIEIGSTNTAGYKMAYRHSAASGSLSTNEGTHTRWIHVPAGFTVADNTSPLLSNDRDQITYYTPRWEGFQFGASYIPAANEAQFQVTMANRAGGVASTAAANANLLDGFSGGLNYDNKFGDFRVQAAGVFEHYNGRDGTADDDATAWGLSTILTYGGFSAGVSYLNVDYRGASSASTATGTTTPNAGVGGDLEVYHFGAGYRFGATFVTATYTTGEAPGALTTAGDDETSVWMVAISHDIGPGVSVHGSILGADYDNETGGVDTEGWAGVVGITTRF